jgi:hypothetical protein
MMMDNADEKRRRAITERFERQSIREFIARVRSGWRPSAKE